MGGEEPIAILETQSRHRVNSIGRNEHSTINYEHKWYLSEGNDANSSTKKIGG